MAGYDTAAKKFYANQSTHIMLINRYSILPMRFDVLDHLKRNITDSIPASFKQRTNYKYMKAFSSY
jgi:hypothetical protein